MTSSMCAPIVLFAYKRPNELRLTINALQKNYLASQSDLYVFVDGPRKIEDQSKVEEVKEIVSSITGFNEVHFHFSEVNKGCASSIIEGVSYVLRHHPSVIVVEDDIITTPNFLDFVNQGLTRYVDNTKIFSVGGYTFPFDRPSSYIDDVYFYGRTCAWGWGIWADRWFQMDWSIADFDKFITSRKQRQLFNYYGSDRVRMLRRVLNGEIDTWDIRLCYGQFKLNALTVFPTISKTINIGFNGTDATNTNNYNRYETKLDLGMQRKFNLPEMVKEHNYYTKKLRHQFSVQVRLINRLKTMLYLHR